MSKQPVRVVIRNRPTQESADNITMEKDGKTVTIRQITASVGGDAKQELLSFSCDAVLDNAPQEKVFDEVARPICDAVLDGFNGTIMCYGQTGAGKSFSMVGDGQDYQLRGIAPRAFGRIFREMGNRPEWIYTTRISFLEIYNENLSAPPWPTTAALPRRPLHFSTRASPLRAEQVRPARNVARVRPSHRAQPPV